MGCSFCGKEGHNCRTCPSQTAQKQKTIQKLQAKAANNPTAMGYVQQLAAFYANNPQELHVFIEKITNLITAVKH